MNREKRKKMIKNQAADAKWINPFAEESIKEYLENRDKNSEAQLSKIPDQKSAAELFAKETNIFAKNHGLETIIVNNKNSEIKGTVLFNN